MRTATSRIVEGAVKRASARKPTRRFRWRELSGAVVVGLAGASASTSLLRRRQTEEQLDMADARVLRAEAAVSRVQDALLAEASEKAAQLASVRSAEQVEQNLSDWIISVVEKQSASQQAEHKTSFV